MIPSKPHYTDQEPAAPRRPQLGLNGRIDQGPFKGGTMFAEPAMSDNDNDDGLDEHHLDTPNVVSRVPTTVTRKDTLLDRSYIAKKSKAEKSLKEVYEYLAEKKSRVAAARVILEGRERTRALKKRLEAAKKRAMGARKKMDIATRDSDVANFELSTVTEEVKSEEEQIQSSKKHQLYQGTEDGFRKFQVKVLEMELSSDASD